MLDHKLILQLYLDDERDERDERDSFTVVLNLDLSTAPKPQEIGDFL